MMLLGACVAHFARSEPDSPEAVAAVDTSAELADTGEPTDDDPVPSVAWSAAGLTLAIANGSIGGYWFGMATADYTGEDCVDHNQDDPAAQGHDKCHEAGADGDMWATIAVIDEETAELYRHDRNDDYTALDVSQADLITYILMDKRSLACWVWGASPDYYEALNLGCLT